LVINFPKAYYNATIHLFYTLNELSLLQSNSTLNNNIDYGKGFYLETFIKIFRKNPRGEKGPVKKELPGV
jgi:hypothetical protein